MNIGHLKTFRIVCFPNILHRLNLLGSFRFRAVGRPTFKDVRPDEFSDPTLSWKSLNQGTIGFIPTIPYQRTPMGNPNTISPILLFMGENKFPKNPSENSSYIPWGYTYGFGVHPSKRPLIERKRWNYHCHPTKNWVVVSKIFYFHPYLGKIPNLTSIFFKGVGSTTN